MAKLLKDAGLKKKVSVDSAGTGGWHVGESPDARSRQTGAKRGFKIGGKAQQFTARHFERYDYVVAMDTSNHDNLLALAQTDDEQNKVSLLRDYDAASANGSDVPDPYYDGPSGFDDVIDICTAGCEGLLRVLRKKHGL